MPNPTPSAAGSIRSLGQFDINLSQVDAYEFRVRFDNPHHPQLLVDAPAPIGKDAVPSPSRLLAAAVGHCLASVLFLCARRAGVTLGPVAATVHTELVRNERGLPRVGKIEVEIEPHLPDRLNNEAVRALKAFEDLCMVTQSVRDGIDISCRVNGL